jgi:Mn-dependent DtxR family transcriptional regulator
MSAMVITEEQVFEALLQLAPASSANVAEMLGCSDRTVRSRILSLKQKGEVRFHDRRYVVARTGPTYASLLDERDRLLKEVARLQIALGGRR